MVLLSRGIKKSGENPGYRNIRTENIESSAGSSKENLWV
jgi:hypothetical protein